MDHKIKYIDWKDDRGNMGTSFAIIMHARSIKEAVEEYEDIKFSHTFESMDNKIKRDKSND
tara:strand:+ start:1137 stop:1319 length:183 start_codon:yes stop_codon:yes gene_type:complete